MASKSELTRQQEEEVRDLERSWKEDERWHGISRPYSAAQAVRLRGSIRIEHTIAKLMSQKFWQMLKEEPYIHVLSAMNGSQAIQEVQAGLKSVYVSGWQVAADANTSGEMYPDQSLYPVDSVPSLIRRINSALVRQDQIAATEGRNGTDWIVPLVADAEAGFGGTLNAYELMKAMIEAGAAGVHYEDQLSSAKKCGHLGGKVLVPAREFIQKLSAARLAADVLGVPTVLIARTDALSAQLLTSDIDPLDHTFITGERTFEGFFRIKGGLDLTIQRAWAYAPYADLIWFETSEPNMEEAWKFATNVRKRFPGKMLAYNCSPSFNWKRKLSDADIAKFQHKLGEMGYKYQFITLSAFHAMNLVMFDLARGYKERGMSAYADLQAREFAKEQEGYRTAKHQSFVGVGYFDEVSKAASGGESALAALEASTEAEQFAPCPYVDSKEACPYQTAS